MKAIGPPIPKYIPITLHLLNVLCMRINLNDNLFNCSNTVDKLYCKPFKLSVYLMINDELNSNNIRYQ